VFWSGASVDELFYITFASIRVLLWRAGMGMGMASLFCRCSPLSGYAL
jgi:hypothetical protein